MNQEQSSKMALLQKEYKKLAKKADQRLVRLEKLANDPLYANVDKFAYARAKKDIEHIFGAGVNRFNRKLDNYNSLVGAINDVNTFLASPTSTKRGITKTYINKANAANKQFGTNFTWQDYANYYQSGTADKLTSKMTYREALKKVGKMQNNKKIIKDITAEIQKVKGTNYKVSASEINEAIYDRLEEQKLTISSLSKGKKK